MKMQLIEITYMRKKGFTYAIEHYVGGKNKKN